jgi:hypothetical protein
MVWTGWHGVKCCVAVLLTWLVFSPMLNRAEAAESSMPVLALEASMRWQPPSGEFRFTITPSNDSNVPDVCLAWSSFKSGECPIKLTVRRVSVSTGTPQGATFAATLPRDLGLDDDWAKNAKSYYPDLTIFGWPLMPRQILSAAYLRIWDTAADHPVDFDVAITSRRFAAAATLLAIVLAGCALFRFAKHLGVPGPRESSVFRLWSVPLRLISTANGWASLSQFQVLLWSFVVGGGAVYVMTLTGSLIPISSGTLILLGIAGGAAVLTEVKDNQQSQSGAGTAAPGPVLNLTAVAGQPSTELVITWVAPISDVPVSGYTMHYGEGAAPAQWIEASRVVRGTSLRIVGLQPATLFTVRVCAANPAGNSDWVSVQQTTGPAPAQPPQISVQNVHAVAADITEKSIPLAWNHVEGSTYVQYRRADSDEEWTDYKRERFKKWLNQSSNANIVVTGLRSGTRYQFRVRAAAVVDAWSSVVTSATIHVPKWSDIVTDTDRPAEIDVTRVQMLFFTVISAFFVGLKIVDTGTIPDIPDSYVMLMGISNGVYVTAKFVRN